MTHQISDAECQRGLLVYMELKEATARMRAEGFSYLEIIAGLASLSSDIIATEHNHAAASAWFFGMAKVSAQLAAAELDLPN